MIRKTYLFLLFMIVFASGISLWYSGMFLPSGSNNKYNFILDAMSWNAIPIDCEKEDTISGSFKSSSDGSLYFGDEQKYDNWIFEGIEFHILNYSNFVLFSESNTFNSDYSKTNVMELSWSFIVPSNGTWFLVHYNNSIYMKTIDGTVNHPNDSQPLFLLITLGLLGLACLLSMPVFRKTK
ncbi:MAG: hypothetical protein OEV85_07660 [Candidatus Thorarchaeota archaeon]|nr:hypothetical protein [Candidatus Thorarchaeota archaeon]